MVFVNITPFPPRRIFVLVAALFALSIASCFAQPILLSAKSTPYDRQMARIQPVLNTSASVQHAVVPLSLVNQWIGELRAIPYSFSMEWKTPNEIAHAPYYAYAGNRRYRAAAATSLYARL